VPHEDAAAWLACALARRPDHAARLALCAIESYGRRSKQVSEARP